MACTALGEVAVLDRLYSMHGYRHQAHGSSGPASMKVPLLLFACLAGMASVRGSSVASAQNLSPPLVDIPSASLVPPEATLPTLPAAATNLLAPTAGNGAPPDQLGANLQSTSATPYVSADAGGRPAGTVDTAVRAGSDVNAGGGGTLSGRSLYTPSQVAHWRGSAASAGMKPAQFPDARVSATASWGLPATMPAMIPTVSATQAIRARGAASTGRPAAPGKLHRTSIQNSARTETSIFTFQPGTAETESNFGQTPFESLGGQQDTFLNPDLTAAVRSPRIHKSRPALGLPTTEMGRLQAQLHPPSYRSNYGKSTHTRVTMKALIERESQSKSDVPTLPPIFFMAQ